MFSCNKNRDITVDKCDFKLASGCVCVSDFQLFQPLWLINGDIELKFGTPVKQSRPFNFSHNFHENWSPIWDFTEFWILWKMSVVVLTWFIIEFRHNRLKRSDFSTFWIFWKFAANYDSSSSLLCPNALVLSNVLY